MPFRMSLDKLQATLIVEGKAVTRNLKGPGDMCLANGHDVFRRRWILGGRGRLSSTRMIWGRRSWKFWCILGYWKTKYSSDIDSYRVREGECGGRKYNENGMMVRTHIHGFVVKLSLDLLSFICL